MPKRKIGGNARIRQRAQKCGNVIAVTLILETVLKHTRFWDLKTCRLVSKEWNGFAQKEMMSGRRKLRPIHLSTFDTNQERTIENFIQTFEKSNPNSIPDAFYFEDRAVSCCTTRDVCHFNPITLRKFFQKFAHNIHHLETHLGYEAGFQEIFEDGTYKDMICLEGIFDFEIEQGNDEYQEQEPPSTVKFKLPNLCSINICATKFSKVNFLESILKNMEPGKLVKLRLNYSALSNSPYRLDQAIEYLAKYDQITNLKKLKVGTFKGETLLKLIKAKIQLESLKMGRPMSGANHRIDHVTEFLSHTAPTLTKLHWKSTQFCFPKVQLKILKSLTLVLEFDENDEREIKEINYSRSFPNLEHLCVQILNWNIWNENQIIPPLFFKMFPIQDPAVSVKKLELTDDFLTPELMARISKIFPNLLSLKLKPRSDSDSYLRPLDKIFAGIWNSVEFCQNLKELEIWLDDDRLRNLENWDPIIFDKVFCGVTNDQDLKLRIEGDAIFFRQYDHPRFNSILKLKALETLHICTYHKQTYGFTDVTGYGVFGQMKNLKDLFIQDRAHKFTESCLIHLKNKIQVFGDRVRPELVKIFHMD